MRILVVDDEKLTREGIISSIDWQTLAFDEVDQADDGINALQLAKANPPDVLLTDIRMPRMNGIELAEQLQELKPGLSVIFMSGYSDKEYLKAAIHLRAISYVEKPIDTEEITAALYRAVNEILQNQAQQKSNVMLARRAVTSFAQKLTQSGYDLKEDTFIDDAGLRGSINPSTIFTTCIIRIDSPMNHTLEENLSSCMVSLNELIRMMHMNEIHYIKNDTMLVMHLFGGDRPGEDKLNKIGKYVKSVLSTDMEYFIVFGKTVTGPAKVFDSYTSAAVLLQSTFFFEYGSILFHKNVIESIPNTYPNDFLRDFDTALQNKDLKACTALAETLFGNLKSNRTLLANVTRDFYYKTFMLINSTQHALKLQTEASAADSESLMESISNCRILLELHQLLLKRIEEFGDKLKKAPHENTIIFMIRDYISQHYSDYSLSIKDISDHVHLSSSYLCTVFKTETGETLNQYITDFRIEKAKQLLTDPRTRIVEVSSRVGYADNNYFGKIFKKTVGLTPSEYREKELGQA